MTEGILYRLLAMMRSLGKRWRRHWTLVLSVGKLLLHLTMSRVMETVKDSSGLF